MDEIEVTPKRGWAMVFDAYEKRTSALATVLRDPNTNEPIAAVSIAGPSARMHQKQMSRWHRLCWPVRLRSAWQAQSLPQASVVAARGC